MITTAEIEERLQAVRVEQARRSFFRFFRDFAWPVLQPGTKFVDNWHIHVICEHLEAVTRGEIKRLLINLPFRMLKSTLVSQAWPAWEWIDKPHVQYLTASYAKDVATRDAVDSRRVIESAAYQAAWGDLFRMTSDQNVKTRYENDRKGSRIVTSTDAAGTGFGGNRVIVDDPVSALEADSEVARAQSVEWWKGTASTRMNNPKDDALVVIHQRLNVDDLTGYILENEKGWEHLVLPMRFDPELRKTTSLGFVDPRTKTGELMSPSRLDEQTVSEMESRLGDYHTKAQLQQNPASREGFIFKTKHWRYYKVLPQLDEVILSVDCSFKDLKSSDYVALQAWGRAGANKYLLAHKRDKLGFGATVTAVRGLKARFPGAIAILVEDKANGTAVIETLQGEIPGVLAIEPEGGKIARAYAMQPEHEAGNIWVPDISVDPDIEEFTNEVGKFPNDKNDDQVDGMTQAINWWRKRLATSGLMDFYKEMSQASKSADVAQPQPSPAKQSPQDFIRAIS